ncbi:MAG: metal-sulfur cluster assembly factor [Nitriliruptoraceae bacterium]
MAASVDSVFPRGAAVTVTPGPSTPVATEVMDALSRVRDPELDEPITDLGFVVSVDIDDQGSVDVGLRLPTFFCAPNFAYMMAADARDELSAVPGVSGIRVRLVDHFVDEEVTSGLGEDLGFSGTFEGQTAGDDLFELRQTFARKAYLARTHEVVGLLLAAGTPRERLHGCTLADLPASRDVERYLERRAEIGLSVEPDAPLLLDVWGERVPPDQVDDHLRRARTVNVSIEGNAGFCRGLLETRYAPGGTGKDDGRIDPDLLVARAEELLSSATTPA